MLPELRTLIDDHCSRPRRLLAEHHELLAALQDRDPVLIEREAVATVLHAFYTRVEFIMRSVADSFDGGISKTGAWHASLLESMQ